MIKLSPEDKKYFEGLFEKIDKKMKKVAVRSYNKIPYTAVNGVHDDKNLVDIEWWTNGFWPGMMWIMYVQTGDEQYKKTATHGEDMIRKALHTNITGVGTGVICSPFSRSKVYFQPNSSTANRQVNGK